MAVKEILRLPSFVEYEKMIFDLIILSDEKELKIGYFTFNDFFNQFFEVRCKYLVCIEGIENDKDLKKAVQDIDAFIKNLNIYQHDKISIIKLNWEVIK